MLVIVLDWLPHWLTAVLMFMATLGGLVAAGELFNARTTESSTTADGGGP